MLLVWRSPFVQLTFLLGRGLHFLSVYRLSSGVVVYMGEGVKVCTSFWVSAEGLGNWNSTAPAYSKRSRVVEGMV